ncbi:MAG: hypothetical protein L0170_11840 [Acidobacteria bacterium]|nr:hypothetical protein [Acidobacteriota bacterium]
MKQAGTQKNRKGVPLRARRSGGGRQSAGAENLVAEIVDQITRKQAQTSRVEETHRRTADTCAFCLDKAVAGSSYRLVLKCDAGESPTSDP